VVFFILISNKKYMSNNQGYYYIIPADLAESGNKTKAMLYGLISSLTLRQEYCTASNSYLAKKLGMNEKSATTISRYINELKKEGWIEVKIYKKDGNKREILPIVKFAKDKSEHTPYSVNKEDPIMKKHKTSYEISEDPSYEISEESNISNSNKREYPSTTSNEVVKDSSKTSHRGTSKTETPPPIADTPPSLRGATKNTPFDCEMAELLSNLILETDIVAQRKGHTYNKDEWANQIRLMRTQEKWSEEEIKGLIKWAKQDSFWCKNIMSTKKLRQQASRLYEQAKEDWSKEQIRTAKIEVNINDL
jgi:uncharacterized membrane-anchored protein/biotin operon repressor